MKNCMHAGNCTICCCDSKPALFTNLSTEEYSSLHAERKEIRFKAGEIIFKQGTALTHFACFREGMAKVYFERPEGSNILIDVLTNGKLCGSMGLFTDNIHHLTVQALTDVSICLISTKDLGALLRSNENMAIELITLKNKGIIDLTNKLANLTYKSMTGRVADVLLYLQKDVYESDSFTLNLSRQDMADLAAMTKESFIRTLKELKNDKIVRIDRDKVDILDAKALLNASHH